MNYVYHISYTFEKGGISMIQDQLFHSQDPITTPHRYEKLREVVKSQVGEKIVVISLSFLHQIE
jgi:hypothetical protein